MKKDTILTIICTLIYVIHFNVLWNLLKENKTLKKDNKYLKKENDDLFDRVESFYYDDEEKEI